MQDLMVLCDEVRADELDVFRSRGPPPASDGMIIDLVDPKDPAGADTEGDRSEDPTAKPPDQSVEKIEPDDAIAVLKC